MNKQEWLKSLGVVAVYHPEKIGYSLTKDGHTVYVDSFKLADIFFPVPEKLLMELFSEDGQTGYDKAIQQVKDILKNTQLNVMGYTFDLPDAYYKWQEIEEAVNKLKP